MSPLVQASLVSFLLKSVASIDGLLLKETRQSYFKSCIHEFPVCFMHFSCLADGSYPMICGESLETPTSSAV